MTNTFVGNSKSGGYLLDIFKITKNTKYVDATQQIAEFVNVIYRNIEPSHFKGRLIVFYNILNTVEFLPKQKEKFYDKGILNNHYNSLIFQIRNSGELPLIWKNIEHNIIDDLLTKDDNFIAYFYEDGIECFIVNNQKIQIYNEFSCPSIFALQYHKLNEALLDYKNERVKNASCAHFNKCWADKKWIYLKNKPEDCMQLSLKEFLVSRIRGVDVKREYNIDASKPVDIRVYWKESNRAALIELKWLGQSLGENDSIGTSYTNKRANDGMVQIKEYIDLENSDAPTIITKGYLVVIDGRRRKVSSNKVTSISRENGFYYANQELVISDDKKYWETHSNIEEPIRMFVEPVCEM